MQVVTAHPEEAEPQRGKYRRGRHCSANTKNPTATLNVLQIEQGATQSLGARISLGLIGPCRAGHPDDRRTAVLRAPADHYALFLGERGLDCSIKLTP